MPPKKARTAGSQPVSASQPLPEAPRPTRTSGRKRRHSDASNVSDVSSVMETTEVKTKKQKRGRGRPAKHTPEQEVIVEEEEQVIEEDSHAAPAWPDLSEVQALPGSEISGEGENEEIEASQQSEKHVHFGGDLQFDDDYTTATNITPHPRTKMTVKRRTLSPNAGTESKRFKTNSSRTSLPPNLSQEEYDPARIIQELRFAPLNEILQERVQQLLAKKNARRNSTINGEDVDMKDSEDILVLDSQEEVNYPRLPAAPHTPLLRKSRSETTSEEYVETSTPGRKQRLDWEKERRSFQDAILALSEVADKAKSDIQIISIELDALGFRGEDNLGIIQSMRESFARVREELEEQLPGTVPEDADNEDLLEILSANVQEFAKRLRVADGELNEKSTLIHDLGGQVDGLINRLAEKEVRYTTLHQQWQVTSRSNEERGAKIVDLEEDLQVMTEDRDVKEEERDNEQQRAVDLEKERAEFEASVNRLSESLQQYRNEEDRLTATVNRMEEEHRKTVAAMNKERQETVQDLEDRLDQETSDHADAEKQAEDRQAMIEELEARVTSITAERDANHEELETVRKERDTEIEANDETQAELKERDAEIEDLGARVSRLDTQLEEHIAELDTLRQLNETERRQREAAEAEVDDRDQKIDRIDRQLHEQGKQANELRSKLFEVQQKNEEKIQEMKEEAVERDEQQQADLVKETDAREAAEELADQRANEIQELQARLDEVEQQMQVSLAEKDALIADGDEELNEKDAEIDGLRQDLKNAQDEYATRAQEHNEQAQELDASIAALQETITGHEDTIRTLERNADAAAQEHDTQTEERDAAIAGLNARVAELEGEKQRLVDDKLGLERRVNDEAEAMLDFQNEKNEEVQSLRSIIKDKQDKILVVEEKAKAADASWQEVLDAREEEINGLKTTEQTTTRTVTDLTNANEEIKRRFRDYVRRSSGVINGLQDKVRELNAQAEQDGEDLMQEGEQALGEIETLTTQASSSQQVVSTTQTKQQVKTKRKVGGRKKRVMDSGIGMDGEGVDGEEELIAA